MIRASASPAVGVDRQDPGDQQHQSRGRQDRARGVERRVGSAGSGSVMRRASTMITTMIRAWTPKAARQPRVAVISPPSSGPAAAPIPPIALITPKALARLVSLGEQQGGQDVHGWDEQGGADPFQDRVADDQHGQVR